MELGIIGMPQTGKKSLFGLLTDQQWEQIQIQNKIVSGQAEIRDARLFEIARYYKPKKIVTAKIDLDLLPKIEGNSIKDGKIFNDIADMDALCHVVRAFNNDSVYHVKGSVNPKRDIEEINSELILHDLIFIEKRFERIEKASTSKKKDDKTFEAEKKILRKFRDHLEKDLHLRTLDITGEEEKIISGYPFVTRMKMLIALNIDDDKIGNFELVEEIKEKYKSLGLDVMQVSAKLEAEIAALDSDEERKEFMEDAGIKEPALEVLSRLAMKSLGLISFFTGGDNEVRQWLIRRGSTAPQAGGAVHSDIERGFIRVEVIKFDDLVEHGSEEDVKKAGKLHVMGKDYIIEDGDIVFFRFNV